jgi:hypothetical protein
MPLEELLATTPTFRRVVYEPLADYLRAAAGRSDADALTAHDLGGATCESERWRLDAVLGRVDAKLTELDALRGRIVQAREACVGGRCMLTAASQRH